MKHKMGSQQVQEVFHHWPFLVAFTMIAPCHQRSGLYMYVRACILLTKGLQEHNSMHTQERRGAISGKQIEQEEIRSRIKRSKEVRRES